MPPGIIRRVAAEDLQLRMCYPCPAQNPLSARTLLGRAEHRTATYVKMYKLVANICSIVLAAEARSTLTPTMTVWHAFARRLSLGAHNLHNRCPWHGGLLAQCIPLSGCLSSDLAYCDISGILQQAVGQATTLLCPPSSSHWT